ncbi:D-alanyl-D-alanine carboxypeptidase [Streptomyces sp. sk2.1]|uniref:D-alanyl-D-alanine carboxypeptidase n=1 Tax=Streptomyces sp. sk2.1 TaxID=2478959 RepID=UPI0011E78488|nr:D-alanyl-D-alanine carboxypeptidase [Streptomyces sp. sk2.1]TXS74489.1 D-alanyl-D-alanine carboxypeptidase [Streptomyces sp. sk2.1]
MAGESPDKSEQQKSSGTARSESDPRLAVFREPSAKDATAEGTDTATTVFRAGALAGADGDDEGEGTGGSDGANGADGSDGVKADTATAVFRTRPVEDVEDAEDDRSSEDGEDGEGSEEPAATGAEADTEEPEGSEGPGSAAAADEAEKDAGKGAGGREGASGGVDAGVTGAAGGDGEADAAGSDADAVDGPAGDGSAEAGAAEKAAETVAEAAEEPETPREESGPKDGDEEAAAKGDPPESAASEVKAEAKADSDASEADADAPEADADADGDADDADTDAAKADTSESAAESADADADAKTEKDGKGEKAAGAAAAAEPDAAADADAGSDKDAEEADKAAEDARSAKSAEPDKGDDGADGDDKDDKSGIDQPTAIFRAPAAARVDQPTTALKVISPDSKQTSGPASEPESSAERTSKFVPLRGDDVRPAPAAPRGSGAPVPAATPAAAPPASLSTAERTTQQPMPPKPPLDLLAELTNTPPPPETPVRTAVRRVKIWTPLVLLLLIVFAIVQMVRPLPDPEIQMSAKDTYTFKGDKPSLPWPNEGQGYMAATGLGPVGSFGEQKAVPIGSVAKAMTAYIVLKDHPLKKGEKGPKIKVDAKGESDGRLDAEGESTLNTVKEGDTLTEYEALAAIMIPSANNIARLLARWDAGSEEAFVKKMNETAKELGMKNTTYTDPSGLNATTVSSAEDQVKLGEKLVEIPALMDITKLPSWTDPSGKNWRNYNTLVPYNGALGIKTGSTSKAGGNLLFAAHKMVGDTDQLIVGAVLGQHQPPIIDTVNAVSKEVMTATQDLLENAKVVKKGDVVGTVSDGMGGSVPVVATKDVSAVGWAGLTVRIELTDDGRTIPHAATAGTHVGTLTVGEGSSQVKVAVALQDDLVEPSFGAKLTRIG